MAIIHIPLCLPLLAAMAWKAVTPPEKRTPQGLCENLWAGQLCLDQENMAVHKEWLRKFWNELRGKGDIAGLEEGFKRVWSTEIKDWFPLVTRENLKHPTSGPVMTYTTNDILAWLAL